MADTIKEGKYYRELKDILAGNSGAWEGVYDDKEAAEEAAQHLTRTLFGSTSKENKAKSIGTGRFVSQIKGMNDLLPEIKAYITTLTVDDKQKAKEYIEGIIAQDSKNGIMKTVKKVLAVKNNKIPVLAYLPVTTSDEIEESTENKIKGFIADAKENLRYLDFKTILTSAVPLLGTMGMMNALEGSGILRRTPELTMSKACFVGPIPLQHIREIEVARSGQKLKFRATGSVFLAKQEGGGTDAVRVSGKFYRGEISILVLILALYEFGAGRVKDLDLSNPADFNMEAVRTRKNILQFNTERAKPSVESHNTFPFVSRHVIIPNCYIETLSFEERIENGMSVVSYDILLRTFSKQKSFKVWNSDDPNIKYVATVYNEKLTFHKMFEYGINAIWRYIQSEHFVINTGYWKVGITTPTYGNPQARDVYYNLDAFDVAGTFAMGAMGLVGRTWATLGTEGVLNVISGVAT